MELSEFAVDVRIMGTLFVKASTLEEAQRIVDEMSVRSIVLEETFETVDCIVEPSEDQVEEE